MPPPNFLSLELPERLCQDLKAAIGDISDLARPKSILGQNYTLIPVP